MSFTYVFCDLKLRQNKLAQVEGLGQAVDIIWLIFNRTTGNYNLNDKKPFYADPLLG